MQNPESLTPEILCKNTSTKTRPGFDMQSEIFDIWLEHQSEFGEEGSLDRIDVAIYLILFQL